MSDFSSIDMRHMERALSLAERGRGKTSPNPMVGAVLVKGGRVIAEGWHRKAGTPHAEALALRRAGSRARGATLYVTLEPCCHTDKKTPPCTEAIIASGISKVVAAMTDPNPKVAGRGFARLRQMGIEVVRGVLEREARALNRVFVHNMKTARPYVLLKVAQSLDGRIATAAGASKWITGPAARKAVHRLRSEYDAIMVGLGTVKADDPSLTARVPGGRNPIRIIVDHRLEIPGSARVLDASEAATWVATCADPAHPRQAEVTRRGARLLHLPPGRDGRVDLDLLMAELYLQGIASVLLEGGSGLNGAALRAGIVQRVLFFVAPMLIGGEHALGSVGGPDIRALNESVRLKTPEIRAVGRDLMIEADVIR